MPEISIIIRTKNEERWIRHCLTAVFNQDYKDFEVILVDNESSDHTVAAARRFPLAQVVTVEKFIPGHALNEGIRHSSGRLLVCLSAHCIPKNNDWLSRLLENMKDPQVAGVYGRQLPMAFTKEVDKRDLTIVFGLDRRIQVKDYFFHNANSMLRRELWQQVPFDETAKNIEDRIWGKAMIERGYRLVYEPEAPVYHHHGLHHANDETRVRGVVSIIEKIDQEQVKGLPDSFLPGRGNVVTLLPVRGKVRSLGRHNLLKNLLDTVAQSKLLNRTYVLANDDEARRIAENHGAVFLPRPEVLDSNTKSIEDVLFYALDEIERRGDYPDAMLLADYLYPFRPPQFFDELVYDAQFKGLDTVFSGRIDFGNYWKRDQDGQFIRVEESLLPRESRSPIYRALYGLGCLTSVPVIRRNRLVGGSVGILPIKEHIYSLRLTDDDTSSQIIEALLR
ncbi:MAG: glycosyltransferase family 2 protein [Magnetococcales bacterium]|nr:glycosyltransferase family 2 protein [Magnetococcales bacterium]